MTVEKVTVKKMSVVKPKFLDDKFWQNFAANIWEKKSLLIKNVKSSLLDIGEDEIFDLLVLYANQCRKSKNSDGFKFYIDGVAIHPQEVLQFLPVKKDKSLLGYHSRMNEMFADYCLVCDELLKVNSQKQIHLYEFTNQLYKHVGFPNRFSEMGLYLGNYRKTPFGVHIDNCGVFSIPVMGVKKFRLWTPQYVNKNPDLNRAFNYSKHKKSSQLLTVKTGDLSYWPSCAWHIAESDGSFSATWSLGVWVDKSHLEQFATGLNELLAQKLAQHGLITTTPFGRLFDSTGEVSQLPPVFKKSILSFQKISGDELTNVLLHSWMLHISKYGFKSLAKSDFKIAYHTNLKLANPLALILWRKCIQDRSKISLYFAGHTCEANSRSGLLELVKDLNQGKACKVSSYLKSEFKSHNLKALQALAQAGAFAS